MSNEDIKSIKQKSIVALMIERGFTVDAKKSSHNFSFFCSPFTSEKTASFAVNVHKNTFCCYSSSLHGDVIELVMRLDKCNFQTALATLQGLSLEEVKQGKKKQELIVLDVYPLKSKWLIQYITDVRKIELSIANKYCKEMKYQIGEHIYWAICFANNSGGYEIRNANCKIGNSPKDVTTIPKIITKPTIELNVYEGGFDYMSGLTYYRTLQFKNDTIILNSCSFKDKIPDGYEIYNMFVDSDKAGDSVVEVCNNKGRVIDYRHMFAPYKDFNEYLQNISAQF